MKARVFLSVLLTLMFFSVRVDTASYNISWNPQKVQLTLGRGDIKEVEVGFSSSINLQNAYLWIVPELQPFVSIEPIQSTSIALNMSYNTTLRLSIPWNAKVGLYEGTIHLKVEDKTFPQTLKVSLSIVDVAAEIGPNGGTICTPEGLARIEIPSGAVSEYTLITIKETDEEGPIGNIYEFGPSGLSFSSPVSISIQYYQALLPQYVSEEDLFLTTIIGEGYLEPLENIIIDTTSHRVIGQTLHFSDIWITYGELVVDASNNPILSQDIPIASSFRMPIGDMRDFRATVITCHDGLSNSLEDLGNDVSLLSRGVYTNSYPMIEFNSGVNIDQNRWIVSVAFNKSQYLINYESGELADYGVYHPGEDWNRRLGGSSDDGRPLHAIADGVVLYSQTQTSLISQRADKTAGFGNIVVIGHRLQDGSIIASTYAHMREICPCSVGENVSKGDIIGLIGDTGSIRVDGTPIENNHHLHFEIIRTTRTSSASSKVWQINTPVIDEATNQIYIRYSNNSGWYWPKTEDKILANYFEPSDFIKNYVPGPSDQYEFVGKWGSYGTEDGQFWFPAGIAANQYNALYVVDQRNHRIQKFISSGTFYSKWGSYGTGNGQFNYPQGIAERNGAVYVADQFNHRINFFNGDGYFFKKWGSLGNGDGQFNNPAGVAVDQYGDVYVSDAYNHRIQKFSSSGFFITKWGSQGDGDGQFYYPVGVAVDQNDNVYVVDQHNHRIQKFNSSGGFLAKWGSQGTDDGQFNNPSMVAVDKNGNVYVSDEFNHRIQKFSSSGVFLTKWGSQGDGDGQFYYPVGVAVDKDGNVYVADGNNHRIQKFAPLF